MNMRNETMHTLGARIKYYRTEAGLSQQSLAETLGYKSGTAISLIESDARGVDADDIPRFAEELGITTSLLLGEQSEVPSFSAVLRADAELSKKDKEEIINFYNYVKKRK